MMAARVPHTRAGEVMGSVCHESVVRLLITRASAEVPVVPTTFPTSIADTRAVRVKGVLQPALSATLIAFRVEDVMGGRATCAASFVNWGGTAQGTGWLHVDRSLFDLQVAFAIEVGWHDDLVALFDGLVTGLEGRIEGDRLPELVVSGESRPALRAVPKSRVFEHMSRADVFAAIADEHGLQPDVALVRDKVGTIRQTGETDMALVVREAQASGADVWLAGSTLYVHDRRTRASDAAPATAGKDILTCNARLTVLAPTTTRAATEAEVVMRGRREVHPGRIVDLEGIGPLHAGRYLVTRATHTFDLQHGYRTRFAAQRLT